jgi:hypothetical protein
LEGSYVAWIAAPFESTDNIVPEQALNVFAVMLQWR